MTTILVDVKNKTMYSDSRATVEKSGAEYYSTDSLKLFTHPNGNLIAGTFGCVGISYPILKKLGFRTPEIVDGMAVNSLNKRNQCGGVLIINTHNHTICHIGEDINHIGASKKTHRWLSNYGYVSAGSGMDIAGPVFKRTKDPLKAMRYAGIIDKFSDTNIKYIKL